MRIEFCFEYNPIQKWEKFSGVPDCNPEYTIFGFFEVLGAGVAQIEIKNRCKKRNEILKMPIYLMSITRIIRYKMK